jgi:membrane protein YqaA with SNARE-associated domain
MFKQLSRWVLHWADTTHALLALFFIAFAESSFFPIPPDVLLMAIVLAKPSRWLVCFAVCTAGSVLGGMAGYAIGWTSWEVLSGWFFQHIFSEAVFGKVQSLYREYNFWAVFAAGFTPLPYKVFTIAGGVMHIHFPIFVLASVLSRGIRFLMEAVLLRLFGAKIQNFLIRYFKWVTIAFFIVLVGGFYALKHITH